MYFTVPFPMLAMFADKIRLVSVNNFKTSSQIVPSRDRTFCNKKSTPKIRASLPIIGTTQWYSCMITCN